MVTVTMNVIPIIIVGPVPESLPTNGYATKSDDAYESITTESLLTFDKKLESMLLMPCLV